jgi:transposase
LRFDLFRCRLAPIRHNSGAQKRTILIHDARAALCRAVRKRDQRSVWASRLRLRRGTNLAAVALASKNARIIWALLRRGESYRPLLAPTPQPVAGGL